MDLSLKIDVIPPISREEFDEKYLKPQKPVIIRGVVNDQPAGEKWTLNWFKENHGDVMVGVHDSRIVDSKKTAVNKPDFEMKFSEYLDVVASNKPTPYRIFLFNIFKIRPELRSDLKCPKIFESPMKDMGFVFFGGINSVTRMHYDIDMSNVLLVQFEGKKRVVMFDPEQSELLYRLPFNTFGLVNPDLPDFEKYPGSKYAKGYDVTLERGDALFMPSGYWHHIVYTTGGFSVSFRRPSPDMTTLLKGGINLGVLTLIDKMLDKVMGDGWYNYKKRVAIKRAKKRANSLAK